MQVWFSLGSVKAGVPTAFIDLQTQRFKKLQQLLRSPDADGRVQPRDQASAVAPGALLRGQSVDPPHLPLFAAASSKLLTESMGVDEFDHHLTNRRFLNL